MNTLGIFIKKPHSLLVLGHCLEEDSLDLLEGCNWKNKEEAGAVRLCDMPPSDRAPDINPNTPKEKEKQPTKQKGMCHHHKQLWCWAV